MTGDAATTNSPRAASASARFKPIDARRVRGMAARFMLTAAGADVIVVAPDVATLDAFKRGILGASIDAAKVHEVEVRMVGRAKR